MSSEIVDIKEVAFKRLMNTLSGRENDYDPRIMLHICIHYNMELTKRYIKASKYYMTSNYDLSICTAFYYLLYIDDLKNIDNYINIVDNNKKSGDIAHPINTYSSDKIIYEIISRVPRDKFSSSILVRLFDRIRNYDFIILLYIRFPRILITMLQIMYDNDYTEYSHICGIIYEYDISLSRIK